MFYKKFLLLLILLTFIIGVSGGCGDIPYLAGNWEGTLKSAKNPLVSATITITNLIQDSNGNFTGGDVSITYSGPGVIFNPLTATITGENTDSFRARIKARGYVTDTVNLTAIILLLTGNAPELSSGDYYEIAMTLPHFYGCIGNDINQLIGDYKFKLYTQSAPLGQIFDEGEVDITRTY